MGSEEAQKKAFVFLLKKFKSQEIFTKDEFQKATKWGDKTFKTYFSKQYKTLLIKSSDNKNYKVSEAFRRFISWDKFKNHVTQNRHVATDYSIFGFDNVIIFEFFMPLTNEGYLRNALDALFYEDSVINRLKSIEKEELEKHFEKQNSETVQDYYERICKWISKIFGGYSISHVNGRFRAEDLCTRKEACNLIENDKDYLIDETTAIVKFIFPCGQNKIINDLSFEPILDPLKNIEINQEIIKEANTIRFLFFKLFVQSIVLVINGEDEIWMMESGMRNRLHIWKIE